MWSGNFNTFVDWSAYFGFYIYIFVDKADFDLNPGITIGFGFFFSCMSSCILYYSSYYYFAFVIFYFYICFYYGFV